MHTVSPHSLPLPPFVSCFKPSHWLSSCFMAQIEMLALALESSNTKPYVGFYMLMNGKIFFFLVYLVQEGMKSESIIAL